MLTTTTWSGLAKHLTQVCDVRARWGQGYGWRYLLVLLAVALLAGEGTLVGMHHWLQMHEAELVKVLQPRQILRGSVDMCLSLRVSAHAVYRHQPCRHGPAAAWLIGAEVLAI